MTSTRETSTKTLREAENEVKTKKKKVDKEGKECNANNNEIIKIIYK